MSARTGRFGVFGQGSTRIKTAGAAVGCAALLLAGCGGSDGSAADAGAPVIRGDVAGSGCEAASGSWTATAAVGGVTRTVVFTAPTYTSPWTTFTATANTGQSATISTSASSGSIQVRGLTKKANNTFIVTGTTANGCTYTSPPSITVSGDAEAVAAPDAPSITTIAAGNGRATVTVAAASTGATPVSYTVTASPAVTGGACTLTGESGSCDVTGLTNGTAYTFTATATNAGGTSAASAASAPVTPVTVPGAPTIGAVTASGSTSATVAFTAPASNGGSPISKYTATSDTGGITGTVSQSGSGTITVAGLTAGTSYTFTVTATNAAGTSAASGESTSVTLVNAPAAPAKPTVVAGDGKVTVTVAAGATGGIPASYTVTVYTTAASAAAGTCTVTGASGYCEVTGLTNGTAYTSKATATNGTGTSTASLGSTSVTPRPAFTAYALGATGPGGGKVFYVSDSGFASPGSTCADWCHYLEAQTTDSPNAVWCNVTSTSIAGTFSTAIGGGYANTQNMSQGCTSGAWKAAWESTSGGVTDWYLPSPGERTQMEAQKAIVGGLGGFYWSSFQRTFNTSDFRKFALRVDNRSDYKAIEMHVRPVRAF